MVYLLTRDREIYRHEIEPSPPENVQVIDVDTHDSDRVLTLLKGIPGLAGLINSTDTWSKPAIAIAESLGLPCQDRKSVELVRDKTRLRQHLFKSSVSRGNAIGFVPGSDETQLAGQQVGFPLVLKDSSGTSSKNVWLIDGPQELSEVVAGVDIASLHGGTLTAEPYFSGPLYSAETLTWDGDTKLLGVSSRTLSVEPYFREEAISFPVGFSEDLHSQIAEWIRTVLSTVGYSRGFTHTEFILTGHGPEVVEINPRIGGALVGESINQAYGVNIYEAFVDMALGERPRIMGDELRPLRGVAQVLVYPQRKGTFSGYLGVEKLKGHRGEPKIYPVRSPGDRVEHITDQRGNVGIILVTGESSEEAAHNASSSASKIQVLMG